jgi:hypothetical protein
VSSDLLDILSAGALEVTAISPERYAFVLPVEPGPDQIVARLSIGGASIVSINPVRDTLEDLFVRQVSGDEASLHDRGLGTVSAGAPQ